MADPIRFYRRSARTVETEKIFGEKWLRLGYENPAGRFFIWLVARRKLFSWWYGRKMNRRRSALEVLPFITEYNINVDEFAKSPFDYKTFNEFFYRALKPDALVFTSLAKRREPSAERLATASSAGTPRPSRLVSKVGPSTAVRSRSRPRLWL